MNEFDQQFYRKMYGDLDNLDIGDLYRHYIESGKGEGRAGSLHSVIRNLGNSRDNADQLLKKLKCSSVVVISHDSSLTGAPVVACNLAIASAKSTRMTTLILFGNISDALADLLLSGESQDLLNVICLDTCWRNRVTGVNFYPWISSNCKKLIANSIESLHFLSGITEDENLYAVSTLLIHEHPHNYSTQWLEQAALSAGSIVFSSKYICSAWQRLARSLGYYNKMIVSTSVILRQPVQTIVEGTGELNAGQHKYFHQAPCNWGKSIRIIGAGYVQYRKGVDIFISKITEFARKNRDVHISAIWIGKTDPSDYFCQVAKYLATEANIEDNLSLDIVEPFLKYRAAILEADIVLFPARFDPLPNFILDCLDCGKLPLLMAGGTGFDELYKECIPDKYRNIFVLSEPQIDVGLETIVNILHESAKELYSLEFSSSRRIIGLLPTHQEYLESIISLPCSPILGQRYRVTKQFWDVSHVDKNVNKRTSDKFAQISSDRLTKWGLRPMYESPLSAQSALAKAYRSCQSTADRLTLVSTYKSKIFRSNQIISGFMEKKSTSLTIHVHCHYPDYLDLLMCRMPERPEIEVIITCSAKEIANKDWGSRNVRIVNVLNQGRNIVPLLDICKDIKTDYLLHMHVKKSLQNNNDLVTLWNQFLQDALLGHPPNPSSDYIFSIMNMMSTLDAHLAFPLDQHCIEVGKNTNELNRLMAIESMPAHFSEQDHFPFPVGAMFYCSKYYIQALNSYLAPVEQLLKVVEPISNDGTILHAFERFLPILAAFKNQNILLIDHTIPKSGRGPRSIGLG